MSAFALTKTLTVAVSATTSDMFPTGEYSGGSFHCPAVLTGNINFEVSNDGGTTWDTLSNAAATFADIATPAANKPRALPTNLFQFRHARFKTSTAQLTTAGSIVVNLFGS